MIEKLKRNNFPVTSKPASTYINDAVGIRIICSFLENVWDLAKKIETSDKFILVKTKDYIRNPKVNGYRSYHIVLKISFTDTIKIPVEIQIRTISQDSWANLEHQIKYKKDIFNQKIIQRELKRCADEMASTDMSMQTIKELIQ